VGLDRDRDRHGPGIQPADVEELLVLGATTVVLSQGMERRLRVDPRTLRYLAERSVDVRVLEAAKRCGRTTTSWGRPHPRVVLAPLGCLTGWRTRSE
jgi:hypothetical protein